MLRLATDAINAGVRVHKAAHPRALRAARRQLRGRPPVSRDEEARRGAGKVHGSTSAATPARSGAARVVAFFESYAAQVAQYAASQRPSARRLSVSRQSCRAPSPPRRRRSGGGSSDGARRRARADDHGRAGERDDAEHTSWLESLDVIGVDLYRGDANPRPPPRARTSRRREKRATAARAVRRPRGLNWLERVPRGGGVPSRSPSGASAGRSRCRRMWTRTSGRRPPSRTPSRCCATRAPNSGARFGGAGARRRPAIRSLWSGGRGCRRRSGRPRSNLILTTLARAPHTRVYSRGAVGALTGVGVTTPSMSPSAACSRASSLAPLRAPKPCADDIGEAAEDDEYATGRLL